MKAPYRYLIGIGIGLAAGLVLGGGDRLFHAVGVVAEITQRLGLYLLLPLVFFSLPIAVTRLRRVGKLGGVLWKAALYAVISGAVFALLGTLSAWFIGFGRIPVIPGTAPETEIVGLVDLIRNTITRNGFRTLVGESSFLLPIMIPAFLLGWHFHHDREISEPAYNFFDSLSRLIYRANRYLLILMPGFLAVFTTGVVLGIRRIVDFQRFLPLLGILLGITFVLVIGVYPLLLWLAGGRKSPWRAMKGMSGALLGAAVSASPLFNYGNLTMHLKENLNISRQNAALTAPAYLMFARAGTAMVTAFCMMTVIRSYSSLEITLFQAAWTALFSFLISFALPAAPVNGLAAALIMMGGLYGRGLDDGWLILAPILPILFMITALLDTSTWIVMILLLNKNCGLAEDEAVPGLRF
jgi:aerobic C4-dicarboxylate transport protein